MQATEAAAANNCACVVRLVRLVRNRCLIASLSVCVCAAVPWVALGRVNFRGVGVGEGSLSRSEGNEGRPASFSARRALSIAAKQSKNFTTASSNVSQIPNWGCPRPPQWFIIHAALQALQPNAPPTAVSSLWLSWPVGCRLFVLLVGKFVGH